MNYTSRHATKSSAPTENLAHTRIAQPFSDQRASTLIQLKQQAMFQQKQRPVFIKSGTEGTPIIQAKHYSTTAHKNPLHCQGYVDVATGTKEITLKGKLIGNGGEGISPKGSVYIPEYKVADDRNQAPARIREEIGSAWDSFWKPSDALRVQALNADPKRMRMGQLLTYEHGLEARARGKPYVLAMSVSDARGPFYTPLGFQDYNTSKPWTSLRDQHQLLDQQLRTNADNMTGEEILLMQQQMAKLKEEMSESSMIIDTNALIANSQQGFSTVWDEE